jgi:Holliday junction DNA helicase RuvA
MIAYLEGVLREKEPTRVVLDVNGVGYEVLIPLSTFYDLPDEGKTVALRIHTHVREDALLLFGFRSARERLVFELLLRTSGVGPKLAQAMLSGLEPDALLAAVEAGDLARLRSVPGVGQKTAERIVVELRERARELLAARAAPTPARSAGRDERAEETASALVNLGWARAQAERAADAARADVAPEAPLEAWIRAALRRVK